MFLQHSLDSVDVEVNPHTEGEVFVISYLRPDGPPVEITAQTYSETYSGNKLRPEEYLQ